MWSLLMREPLPDRRYSWTQRVVIDGQSVYLTVGEYEDGRPGEVFIDVSRQGTFLRGVMGSLARTISVALQCGAGVDVIVHALRGLDYPPAGPVSGSPSVTECVSVTDWIASELRARYMDPPAVADDGTEAEAEDTGEVPPPPPMVERVAGAYAVGSGV